MGQRSASVKRGRVAMTVLKYLVIRNVSLMGEHVLIRVSASALRTEVVITASKKHAKTFATIMDSV